MKELAAAIPTERLGRKQRRLKQVIRTATDKNERSSFEDAVREHSGMVYAIAYRLLGERDAAEELTQEVFLRAFRAWSRFRYDSSERTWFTRITINAAKSRKLRWKRRARSKHSPLEAERGNGPALVQTLAENGPDPERRVRSREIQERVQEGLLTLVPEYREAVILRDVEGLEYREISQVLEVSVGTVKSRIARGRAALREQLKDLV